MKLSRRERQLLFVLAALFTAFLAIQVAAAVWLAIVRVADVLLIFLAAWGVSFLLAPMVNRIDEGTRLNRLGAVALVYVAIALILAGVLAIALPALVAQLTDIVDHRVEYSARATTAVADLQRSLERNGLSVDVAQLYSRVPERLGEVASAVASDALGVASATATLLFDVVLVLIIAFIMLMDGEQLWRRFVGALSTELASEAELLRQSTDRAFGGFLRGSLLLGVIYGVATLVILVPLGVPFPGLLALLSGLTMLVPFFGPIIAAVPVAVATLLGAPDRIVPVFVAILALQQVVLNVISPRVMSRNIGIHPLFVFLALLLGARLGGFWGVFLAMPIAGIANTLMRYVYEVQKGRRTRADASTLIEDREALAQGG